jgi:hypothetical protein
METPAASPAPAPTTSLAARMFNVFATPGEVFAEVKPAKPSTDNWLAPTLLAMVVGIVSVFIIFSQPAIIQQNNEKVAKVYDEQVKAGHMTRAEADQAEALAGKFAGPTVMKFTGSIGAAVAVFARVFWWALVLWLAGRWFLKARFTYQQALEVAGLASMVASLGNLVTTLLIVSQGKVVSVSLAWFTDDANPRSLLYLTLSAVEFFSLWLMVVLALGLARLAGTPWTRALPLTLGYWLLVTGLRVPVFWLMANLDHLSHGFK